MTKRLSVEQLCAAIEHAEPGLLGTRNVSHTIVNDQIHLLVKDNPEQQVEVWLYQNADRQFVYERRGPDETEQRLRDSVDDLVDAVYGNDPGTTAAERAGDHHA